MSDGRFRRVQTIVVRALAALVVLAVLLLVGIHLAPTRRLVLRSVLPLTNRWNVLVSADSLDYNLFRLTATVRGVRVAATRTPDMPFFTADIQVTAPPGVLRGLFSLTRVDIQGGVVRILRTASGTNLPTSSSTSTTEPAPLRLGRVTASLAVDVRDEVSQFSVDAPRMTLDLSPGGGQLDIVDGRIGLRGETINVTRMSGAAAFDGRALIFEGMNLASDVATLRIDGPLNLITRNTGMVLRIGGRGDVARMTALATPVRVFSGDATFEGTVVGPFTAPVTTMNVQSDRLVRDRLALTGVNVDARVTTAAADFAQSTFGLAGGRVEAAGRVAFDGSGSRVSGRWSGVDVPRLIGELVDSAPTVLPAGSTSGTIESVGPGFDLVQWTTNASVKVDGVASVRNRLALPGQSRLALRNGAWTLDGGHRVGDVAPTEFRLSGTVRRDGGVPVGGSVEVGATSVSALMDVLSRVGVMDAPTSLLSAGTLTATGTLGGDLARPTLAGNAVLDGVRGNQFALGPTQVGFDTLPLAGEFRLNARAESAEIAGQPLTDVDATLTIIDSVLTLDSLTALSAIPTEQPVPGRLSATGRYEFRDRVFDLQSSVAGWQLTDSTGSPVRGVLDLQLAGNGTVDRPQGDATATVADAFYQTLPLGMISAKAVLDGEQATLNVEVPRLNLTGTGRSGLVAPYAATADVTVQAVDLSLFQPLVASPSVMLQGTATAQAHAQGDLAEWRDANVTVDLTAAEALLGDLRVVLDGAAQVSYSAGSVGTIRLGARAGGLQAEVRGSLPVNPTPSSAAAMTVTLIGDVNDLVSATRLTRLVDVPAFSGDGPLAVLARIDGSLRQPDISADIDLGPATLTAADFPTLERVRVLAHVEDGRAEVQDLFLSTDGAEITATASAPLSWVSPSLAPAGTSTVTTLSAQLKNVTAGLLGRLASGRRISELQGSLDARVDLSSPTPDVAGLTGEVTIDRLDLSAASLVITQAAPTRIVLQGGVARVESWNWTGEGAKLMVEGQVQLSNLEAALRADGELDLRLLTPFLRSSGVATAGLLTPHISISGPLTTPRIDGEMTLADVDVRLTSPRVFVSGLAGRAAFNRDRMDIVALDGTINGGTLKIGGNISFAPRAPVGGILTADFTGMALEYPEGLRTELDGTLNLTLREIADGVDRIPFLGGSVRVVNGSYREQITVVGGVLSALQSRSADVPARAVSNPSGILALDITVTTEEDIVVDNDAATLALDADVRVIGTAAQPALSGRAEIGEGGRVLLGRNTYQVVSGTLDFANPGRIDPELNFQLTTRAGGVAIEVAVTGTASSPKLALSSEDSPELAQSDLTSLLLTGRTVDQLGSADAQLVGNVLVGNLSGEVGQVLGVAGRAVGIDTIRLGGVDESVFGRDPTAIATAADPTTRLTFTKAFGSNVDVTFSQSLRDGSDQTWVVDYLPSRRFLARLVSNDDDLRSYEFRHDVQIGSSTRAREVAAAARRTTARVSEVTVTGGLPGQNLDDLVELEAGDRFDFATLQDDRDRLEEFLREQGYLTARVGARQTMSGETVAVALMVQPGPPTKIEVTGAPLADAVIGQVAEVWGDSLGGPLLIEETRSLVTDRLAEEGYLRAKVEVTLSDVGDVRVLRIAADPGPRSLDVAVVIEGLSDDLADELGNLLWQEELVPLAPLNPQPVSDFLVQALRERGFMDPKLTIDDPVFTGDMAVVTVHVVPGDQIFLGPVTIVGSTLADEAVRRALDLTEGLSYLQAAVDNAETRLTSFYRQEGFPEVMVTVQTVPRLADKVIGVAVTVVEGPRQTVGSVTIEGLRRIDLDVAIRAMNLRPGQPARAEELLRARTRLFSTGLFRRVDVASSADPEAGSTSTIPMRVVATVEEWPSLRFRYGVQVAEERADEESGKRELIPGLSADITRRTIFGRAVSVGGAAVLQRRSRLGRVFVTSPTFRSLPIRSSLVLEKEREEFAADNVSDVTKISWEQRSRFIDNLELVYSYKYERVHSFTDAPPDPNFPPFDISLKIARLTGTAAWDSRSDPVAPVRGSLVTFTTEHSPEILGSEIRFFRYFTQARHFQSWRGTVFASSFQYGRVNPLGGQEVIPTERFYTGGDTSIRGLPQDGAGEQGPLGPTGGRVLLLLNQEARVPLHRWLQGVMFIDSGNVFQVPGNVSFSRLVTSIGGGVRIVTPFALLRIDYGRAVVNGPENTRGRWSVGLGHAF